MTSRHWLDQFWGRACRRPPRTRNPVRTRARLHCEEFEPRTLLSIATHFSVVPSADYVQPGIPFSVTVTAEDDAGQPADYLGPVHFTSQDPQATLPADYTFTAADHGVHTFSGVIIRTFRIGATQDISAGTGLGLVSEFVPGTAHSDPEGITAGPDNNLWFTENFGNKIAKITPQGAITEFPVPSAGPHGITAGPDGNLWYTTDFVNTGNHVGRITPTGTVTEFQLPTNSATYGITAGPDGNLWFTELAGKVGRITPIGTITEFNVNGNPQGITRGPDGNLWFVDHLLQRVGKITPSGVVTGYQLPSNSEPEEITAGTDGNLWFTESGSGPNGQVPSQVGRITPTGAYTEFLVGGSLFSGDNLDPTGITAGPDGYLWFTERGADRIGRINGTGVPNFYSIPTGSSQPYEITKGPDGNLWFTESDFNASRVGRINLVPTAGTAVVHGADSFVVTTTAGNPDVAGTPFSVTITAFNLPRHIDTGYHNTVHFTSSDSAATLPANYTFTAADNGVHTFSGVILRTAGSGSVTATDSVNSHGSAAVNVAAAAASQILVSTAAASPDIAGTPLDVTVTVQDIYGNTATGYTGTVHFSSGDPFGASLPADYTFTAADQGVHTFAAGATLYTAGTTAVAYANGFGDPSQITANGNTAFPGTPATLRLTDGGSGEYSSAWYNQPVGLGAFTTTFTFQDQPVTDAGDGLCFVLQADPRGLTALGGSEGYGGIVNSIAIKFDLFTHGYNTPSTGLFTGGDPPDGDPSLDVPLTNINLGSGDPLQVTLTYDGTGTLTETVRDTVTQALFTHTYALNLAQVIGTDLAYAGFTGSSGAETAVQDIVSWTGSFHSAWDITATDAQSGFTGAAFITVQAAPAVAFQIIAPASASSGGAFDITVIAVDPYGNTDTNYTGTITFGTSDGDPGVVLPPDYTFQTSDTGMAIFPGGVTLITLGDQTLTATDTVSGFTGAATVTVTPRTAPGAGGFRANPSVAEQPPLANGPPVTASPSATAADPASFPVRAASITTTARRAVLKEHVWSELADPLLSGLWMGGLVLDNGS